MSQKRAGNKLKKSVLVARASPAASD